MAYGQQTSSKPTYPSKKPGSFGNKPTQTSKGKDENTKPTHYIAIRRTKEEVEAGAELQLVKGIFIYENESKDGGPSYFNLNVAEDAEPLAPGKYRVSKVKAK